MLTFDFGFWEEWSNPHKVTFDPENKLIIINSGVTSLDVGIDLYSDWKEWVQQYDNAKWAAAFRTIGGDPTSETQTAPAYYFLINGWKVYAKDVDVVVQLNLYSDDGLSPFVVDNAAVTNRGSDVPVVKDELEQRLTYGDRIYYDETSSWSGVIYPYGTIAQPINNPADAVTLAETYGIKSFYCLSDVTMLDSESTWSNYSIYGINANLSLTISGTGTTYTNMLIDNFIINADFGGGTVKLQNCVVNSSTNLSGEIKNSQTEGVISVYDHLVLSNCYSGIAGNTTTIYSLSEGRDSTLSLRAHSGGVRLTDVDTTGSTVTVELIAGHIELSDTCNNGSIDLRGVGYIEDNSNGSTINKTGFVDSFQTYIEETRAIDQELAYSNQLVVDTVNGISGITYPIGTTASPVNNIFHLFYLSNYYNIKNILVRETLIISGMTFVADDFNAKADTPNVPLYVDGSMIYNVDVTGFDIRSADFFGHFHIFNNCILRDIQNLGGHVINCNLDGGTDLFDFSPSARTFITILSNTNFINCHPLHSTDAPVIRLVNSGGTECSFRNYSGDIIIDKMNNDNDEVIIDIQSGNIILTSGCTNGYIDIRGVGYITNNAGSGCTVVTTGFVDSFQTYIEETRSSDERLTYGNAIYVDTVSGTTGTTYPVGTILSPVNNIADAYVISQLYNIKTFNILSDLTVSSPNNEVFDDYNFIGYYFHKTMTVNSPYMNHARISNMYLNGDLNSGYTEITNCEIQTLTSVNGHMNRCQIAGTVTVANELTMDACFSGEPLDSIEAIVDMNHHTATLFSTKSYSGDIVVKNCNDSQDRVQLDLISGKVILDSSNVSGIIDIRGVGYLTDNSSSGCTVVTTGFVDSFESYAETTRSTNEILAYNGRIYLDTVSGYTGTTYPVGTIAKPTNNIDDMLTIASTVNTKDLYLFTSFISQDSSGNTAGVSQDFNGFNIYAVRDDLQITVNSGEPGIISSSRLIGFHHLNSDYKGESVSFDRCNVENFSGLRGTISDSVINGYLNVCGDSIIDNSYAGKNEPSVNITCVSGATVLFREYSGNLTIGNMNNVGDLIEVDLISGRITIDSGCTNGTIDIRGVGYLIDNSSSGCTVITTGLVDSFETYINQNLALEQLLAYNNEIYYDEIGGTTGTTYPVGTFAQPVNNLVDLYILSEYITNIKNIVVRNDITVTGLPTVVDKFEIRAESPGSTMTIVDGDKTNLVKAIGFNVENSYMYGSYNSITDGTANNIYRFRGRMNEMSLNGLITIDTNAILRNCNDGIESEPIIRLVGDSGTTVNFNEYNGDITFDGMSNPNDDITINLSSGRIILTTGCTDGVIDVRGTGTLVDNSGAGCTVLVDGFISKEYISDAVWDEPILDHTGAGTTGNALYNVGAGADPTIIANTVWSAVITGYTGEGTAGNILLSSSGSTDKVHTIHSDVKRILGLNQENFRIMDHVYDNASNTLQSATVKIYNNSTDCDNDTNALASYSMVAQYDASDRLISYKVTKN